MKESSNRGLFTLIGIIVAAITVVLVYIAYLFLSEPSIVRAPEEDNYSGITRIEPAQAIPDFSLSNQNGETLSLSALYGKPILLTFGFTHCPDVCPITLGEMRAIYNRLDNRADDIHYLFISVDGQRDTPQVLADYFKTLRVDTFMLGMTGTESALRELGIPFGLDFIYGQTDNFGNYSVEHTAGMFLLDSAGNWIRRYTYGTVSQVIATDIRSLVD